MFKIAKNVVPDAHLPQSDFGFGVKLVGRDG